MSASEESNSGQAIDSARYQRFSSNNSWFGGGIVLNRVGEEVSPVDLSSYSNKTLKFL